MENSFVRWGGRYSEKHRSLTGRQASMMFKLVITRCINSAFLLYIITSDTALFDSDTLTKVIFQLTYTGE